MTERKTFTPYGYNPYQHQPGPSAGPSLAAQQERVEMQRRNRGLIDKVFGEEIAGKMRTPLFATVALLAVGVAFAGIVAISYPDGGSSDGAGVPIITADSSSFKTAPGEADDITLAHQDSTVFGVMDSTDRPIENLLEASEPTEEAVDTLQAFAEEAKEAAQAAEKAAETIEPAAGEAKIEAKQESAGSVESLLDIPEAKEEPVEEILRQVEPEQTAKVQQTIEKVPPQELAKASETTQQQPQTLHAAGSSPDTIAFVRSVLDQKDSSAPTTSSQVAAAQAANLAAVEPASGGNAATTAPSTTPGNYYVQLGSVTSSTGAETEWSKMQKDLPLTGLNHRVQEANLGERGTFYRIQAGPMSKDSATSLCDAIKAQKPGGCLVVQ
ncbi:MAG: SPOR domain-containing protein [Alphaproteobacteria bacterium]|nr:SPOR domain-containing protein [Alphaproteobacteria bacterium]